MNVLRKNILKSVYSRRFTLIEALVALAILTLSVASFLALLSSAGRRIEKADKQWRQNHMLAQAVEFYLLYPPETEMDRKFFPYDDFFVSCQYDSPEDLPEGTSELIGQFRLTVMKIRLYRRNGGEVDAITMDRIVWTVE